MKGFKWIVLLALLIAGCRVDSPRYPVFSRAEAATMDTVSNTQNIELDLSVARSNEQYRVRGKQVYYDLGLEPSKVGAISVRLNSTQAGAITLAPGGSIDFDAVATLYITNAAQPGKSATLLVNENAAVSNNPTSPLSAGVNSNRYGIGDPNLLFNSASVSIPALGNSLDVSLVAANPGGLMILSIELSVHAVSYKDAAYVYIQKGASVIYLMNCSNGQTSLENVYLPPGWSLNWHTGARNLGLIANGDIGSSIDLIYKNI